PAAGHQDFEHGSTFLCVVAGPRRTRIIAAWRGATLRRAAQWTARRVDPFAPVAAAARAVGRDDRVSGRRKRDRQRAETGRVEEPNARALETRDDLGM